jgi:two-component system, NarL family, sensor kinase
MDKKIVIVFLASYFIILLLLVVAIVWLYRAIKTHNTNHQATLLLNKEQHQHQLLQAKIETQEQAFSNIARELHDNVGQQLTYLKLQMSNNVYPIAANIATKYVERITHCIEDIRGLARSLNGEYMLTNGLLQSITDFIENSNRLGRTQCSFTIEGEPVFLQTNQEIILYRAIQEAFNNIAKHAQASHASLRMVFAPTQLQVFIVDDGVGFNAATVKSSGLTNIQSRLHMLQGTCTIQSCTGTGTQLHISLPINLPAHA